MITQQRLKKLFYYDALTGNFGRRAAKNRFDGGKINKPIGIKQNNGYLILKVDRENYLVHCLVWLYVYGEWPTNDLCHLNQNTLDNRIANLGYPIGQQVCL